MDHGGPVADHTPRHTSLERTHIMDLTRLSDEDLATHKREVLIEEERRQARDQIPAQIADLTARFIDAGGDPNDLPVFNE